MLLLALPFDTSASLAYMLVPPQYWNLPSGTAGGQQGWSSNVGLDRQVRRLNHRERSPAEDMQTLSSTSHFSAEGWCAWQPTDYHVGSHPRHPPTHPPAPGTHPGVHAAAQTETRTTACHANDKLLIDPSLACS